MESILPEQGPADDIPTAALQEIPLCRLLDLCRSHWTEIREAILNSEKKNISVDECADRLNLNHGGSRFFSENLGYYAGWPHPDELKTIKGLGEKKLSPILLVLLVESGVVKTLQQPTSTAILPGEDLDKFLARNWNLLRQAILKTPLADKLLTNLSAKWNVVLHTRQDIRVRDVLAYGSIAQFIKAAPTFGPKKAAPLAQLICRVWAEADPEGYLGPKFAQEEATISPDTDSMILVERAMDAAGLTDNERNILRQRSGLDGLDKRTLEEIGAAMGVTRERVRQLEKGAISKLTRNVIGRKLVDILALRQEPAILQQLRELAGSNLIPAGEIPSINRLTPLNDLVVCLRHDTLQTFLGNLAANGKVERVDAGWWCGSKLPEEPARKRLLLAQIFHEHHDGLIPLDLLAERLSLSPETALPIAEANGYHTHMGIVHSGRMPMKTRRCLLYALLAAREPRSLWTRRELFEIMQARLGPETAPCLNKVTSSLSAVPGIFITPSGRFVALNPAAQQFFRSIPLPDAQQHATGSDAKTNPDDADADDEHDKDIKTILCEILGKLRLTKLDRIFKESCVHGIPQGSVTATLSISEKYIRYAPSYWGLPGLELTAPDRDLLCNVDDLTAYIVSLHGGAEPGTYPFWIPEMEYHWAVWAENRAPADLFKSLLHVAKIETWPVPGDIKAHWKHRKETEGAFRLELPTPDLTRGIQDFDTIYTLALLAIQRGNLGYATVIHSKGWQSGGFADCDKRAYSTLALLVALDILLPAAAHTALHSVSPGAQRFIDDFSMPFRAHPIRTRETWPASLASTIARLPGDKSLGWLTASELQTNLPNWISKESDEDT